MLIEALSYRGRLAAIYLADGEAAERGYRLQVAPARRPFQRPCCRWPPPSRDSLAISLARRSVVSSVAPPLTGVQLDLRNPVATRNRLASVIRPDHVRPASALNAEVALRGKVGAEGIQAVVV